MSWAPLVADQLSVQAGAAYTVVANVSTAHSKAVILSALQKRGLTVYAYVEGPIENDSRTVTLSATASTGGASVPWSPSFPASLVAHYEIEKVWVWANAGTNQPTPPAIGSTLPSNRPARATASAVFVTLGAVGAVAWYIWSEYGRR